VRPLVRVVCLRRACSNVASMVIWRSDFDKHCVVNNFTRRNWQQYNVNDWDGWHIYWASVQTVYRIFQPDNGIRLEPHQLINHFPNHNELTRKDLMVKNMKRYQKNVRKDGEEVFDFLPATYILPNDHPLFVEEFKRHPHSTWIMKPAGRAQVCVGQLQSA
jgi:tubulin polyglutamylase TTLL1